MNYPLIKLNKTENLLRPTHSSYSDEYAQRMCDLYLSDEIHMDEKNHPHKYYRLHAKNAHSEEMALAYDIKCPSCGQTLKQVGRTLNYNDLGLYVCKRCDK
jgi:C4-type Zn-finger protein